MQYYFTQSFYLRYNRFSLIYILIMTMDNVYEDELSIYE